MTDRLLRLPKKHVGNGSALADSTPLRLCVSATKQFVIAVIAVSRSIGGTAQRSWCALRAANSHLLNRRGAETQRRRGS